MLALAGCDSSPRQEQTNSPAIVPDSVAIGEAAYSGRLYTSGLSEGEAKSLELILPVYQLISENNYFFAGHDSLQAYLGHCIAVEVVAEKWSPATEMVNEQYTYNRGALEVSDIRLLKQQDCNTPDFSEGGQPQIVDKLEMYRGKIRRRERPAPDIAYDYMLQLEEPYRDKSNAIEPRMPVQELPLFLYRTADIHRLEEAILSGEMVMIAAEQVQGYAERSVLQVMHVQPAE